MTVDGMKAAVEKGNKFLVNAQIANDGVKAGWATQVKDDMSVTMGRTYERESVSAFTTKAVVEYLMTVHTPSQEIINAVNSGVEWLKSVKLADKELKVVKDTTMNNGFDVYLVDGSGTWASNYVYDAATKSYRPLYSDVDPTRADADFVNSYDYADLTSKEKKFIFYATRTTIDYYDNTLATELINTTYETWKGYLVNGFPEIPVDTPATGDAAQTTLFVLMAVASLAAGYTAINACSKKSA